MWRAGGGRLDSIGSGYRSEFAAKRALGVNYGALVEEHSQEGCDTEGCQTDTIMERIAENKTGELILIVDSAFYFDRCRGANENACQRHGMRKVVPVVRRLLREAYEAVEELEAEKERARAKEEEYGGGII